MYFCMVGRFYVASHPFSRPCGERHKCLAGLTFLMSEYFPHFLRSSLSKRCAKSKNEFAATENQLTDGGR